VALAAGPAPLLAQEAGKDAKPAPEAAKKAPAAKKPPAGEKAVEPGLESAEAAAEALRSEGKVVSQQGNLDIAVDANFFSEFPGFELGALSQAQRDWLLKRANAVYCTCGCRGDTVARCVDLDPTCQTARKMLQGLLDQAQKEAPEPAATPATPAPPTKP
jgi:hypothetical protein